MILLTPKGDDVQRRSERALNAQGREFFGVLSDREQRSLSELLVRLIERPG